MRRITYAGVAALLLSLSVPARADCGAELGAIDERIGAMELTAEAREEVEAFRQAGSASCAAEGDEAARQFLDPAKFLLGLTAVLGEE